MKFFVEYLDADILTGFDNYEYSSLDTSPISKYVMHPFWNFVVQLVPKSVAPNVLTLAGFLMQVVAGYLTVYYDPYLFAGNPTYTDWPAIPNWVWLACGFLIFVAHTSDGIDGKQARRTNCSGPLGELFDHGLDSWACFFMPFAIISLFGRDAPFSMGPLVVFIVITSVQYSFILTHWEKYNTGILYLPWAYDLSQLFMVLLYFYAFFFGGHSSIWFKIPFLDITAAKFIAIFMCVAGYVGSTGVSLWNVFWSYRNKSGMMLSLYESVRPIVPFILWMSSFLIWAQYSKENVLYANPRLFCYASGVLFSNMSCRLIIRTMSNTRCDVSNILIYPLLVLIINLLVDAHFNYEIFRIPELSFLTIYSIYITLAHIHYGSCVVMQMADHFQCGIFRIVPQNKAAAAVTKNSSTTSTTGKENGIKSTNTSSTRSSNHHSSSNKHKKSN